MPRYLNNQKSLYVSTYIVIHKSDQLKYYETYKEKIGEIDEMSQLKDININVTRYSRALYLIKSHESNIFERNTESGNGRSML